MPKLKTTLKLATAVAIPAAVIAATSEKLKIRKYTVSSQKLTDTVRALLITDLHSTMYGEEQKTILKAIERQKPDIIFLSGDIIDERLSYEGTVMLIEEIGRKYPCYYVPGNHEHKTGEIENIKKLFRSYGICVLAGESGTAFVNGQRISVCGADETPELKAWRRQLIRLNNEKDDEAFTVLLSHRPERVEYYNTCSFDLVLCGHAHGGQVRIPYLLNGLYAPGQGLFPKYAGGEYELDNGKMIVSRGLARNNLPRVFNRPELVLIKLVPETVLGEGSDENCAEHTDI